MVAAGLAPRWAARAVASTGRAPFAVALAGILLSGAGLVLPWTRLALEAPERAFSYPVVFAGLPATDVISYGLLLLLALAAAVAGLVRAHRLPWLLGTAGVALAALTLLFLTATILDNGALVQHIQAQNADYAAIISKLGYRLPKTAPSAVLILPITGDWRTVMQSFQAGWYISLLGGLLVLGAGTVPLLRSLRRHTVLAAGYTVVIIAVAALAIARPLLSGVIEDGAVDAAYKGKFVEAVGDYNAALRLNPGLIDNTTFAVNLGTALRASGEGSSPYAELSRARENEQSGDLQNELVLLRDALGKAPDSLVLRSEYLRVARKLAITTGAYDALTWATNQNWGELPGEHYLIGRALYSKQAYAAAATEFQAAANQADDTDVQSSSYTYLGLCSLGLGSDTGFRANLLHAVALDTGYFNVLARSLTTGLYTTAPPK